MSTAIVTKENIIYEYIKLGRFNNPTAIWQNFMPAFVGLCMANSQFPSIAVILLFLFASSLIRASGCTINDLWDRKIDAKVARTKNRPLASRQINSATGSMFLIYFTFYLPCDIT